MEGTMVSEMKRETPTEVPRKKFMKPPVKVACLSCSRVRCDGQDPCKNCSEKNKECKYEKSKRGGPRVPMHGRKAKRAFRNDALKREQSCPLNVHDQFLKASTLGSAGAGLRHVDDLEGEFGFPDSAALFGDNCGLDQIPDMPEFDAFCIPANADSSWDPLTSDYTPDDGLPPVDVRAYANDADLLDAYYVYIHAYFPVMPPPVRPIIDKAVAYDPATAHIPAAPVGLALAAILALIPLPSDDDPRSDRSTIERRFRANKYATAAFEALDNESEMLDSMINPKEALSNGPTPAVRPHFHPNIPLELETNITYLLLSVYEYVQRGNIKRMMNRGGQSLMLALDNQLYSNKHENGVYAEAHRRVWWMTYINVCQGSIASNSTVAVDLHDPKFTIGFPHLASDPQAYPFFIQCQRAIVMATQYVLDLTEILQSSGDLSPMYMRTVEMENLLATLTVVADAWFDRIPNNVPCDSGEAAVAKSLRAIGRMKLNSARIKIHRYSAFKDTPVFEKRHCDLEPTSTTTPSLSSGSGSVSGSDQSTPPAVLPQYRPAYEKTDSGIGMPHPTPQIPLVQGNGLPFTADFSAQICQKAALDIAETFFMLPYPNPSGIIDTSGFALLANSDLPPRTMPTFSCCAMQSAYALLMLYYRRRYRDLFAGGVGVGLEGSVETLRGGLELVLQALDNYGRAFEAIDGMREQIEISLTKYVV